MTYETLGTALLRQRWIVLITVLLSLIGAYLSTFMLRPVRGTVPPVVTVSAPRPVVDLAASSARLRAQSVRIAETSKEIAVLEKATPRPATAAERDLVRAEKDWLAKRYGPRHPKMIALEKTLAAMEEAASPSPSLTAAKARLEEEKAELDRLLNERASSSALTPARSTVTASAAPPADGSFPGWLPGAIPGFGLLLGLLLAALNDRYGRGFRHEDALESATGLTCLAAVPVPEKADSKWAAHTLQKPTSPEAEAVRTLRAGLKLAAEKAGRPLKVITLTSTLPEEPRSTVAIWLARIAARAGEKVLLLDADLRQPDLHILLGRSNTPSLVDYLTGQTHLEQVIWKQDKSGMHVIFASAVPNTALDLVSSEKMRKLAGYLRQGYDLVLINAPSCLTAADAALLANESDQTLYLVTARVTPRSLAHKGLKLFADFGYTSLSTVLLRPKKA